MDKSRIMVLEKQAKVYKDFLVATDTILEVLEKYDNKQYNKRTIDSINKELYKIMPYMIGRDGELPLVNASKKVMEYTDNYDNLVLYSYDRYVQYIENSYQSGGYIEVDQITCIVRYITDTKKIDYEATRIGILEHKKVLEESMEKLKSNLLQITELELNKKALKQAIEEHNKKVHYCIDELKIK